MSLAWGYNNKKHYPKIALIDGKMVRYDLCHLVEHEDEKPYDEEIWEKIGTGKIWKLMGKRQKISHTYVFYARRTASIEK